MFLVGLTGGIASGKSTVAALLVKDGLPLIDTDLIARQVVEPGTPAWRDLKATFGEEFFVEVTEELKREELGEYVFANPEARRKLNAIIHPRIRSVLMKQIAYYLLTGHRFVVLDCPLLFETGSDKFVQKTVVVHCNPDQQLQRLMQRNSHLNETQARNRINAQLNIEEKCRRANTVLDNTNDVHHLEDQVNQLITDLRGSWAYLPIRVALLTSLAVIPTIIYKIYSFIPQLN